MGRVGGRVGRGPETGLGGRGKECWQKGCVSSGGAGFAEQMKGEPTPVGPGEAAANRRTSGSGGGTPALRALGLLLQPRVLTCPLHPHPTHSPMHPPNTHQTRLPPRMSAHFRRGVTHREVMGEALGLGGETTSTEPGRRGQCGSPPPAAPVLGAPPLRTDPDSFGRAGCSLK